MGSNLSVYKITALACSLCVRGGFNICHAVYFDSKALLYVWGEHFLSQQEKLRLGLSYLSKVTQLVGECTAMKFQVPCLIPSAVLYWPCEPFDGQLLNKKVGPCRIKDAQEEILISSRNSLFFLFWLIS